LVAAAGPAGVVTCARVRRGGRFQRLGPAPVTALAVLRALAGALIEEVIWRGPVLRLTSRPARALAVLGGGVGFVGLHLRRDGRAAWPVHAVNTASWTAAALVGGSVRWPVLSHAAYNVAAWSLRSDPDEAAR
jgi:hypothetical protein